ncbi:MAG: PEGA domain-containing protein [Holophagales bacterium]|nr:PEGA domain-containing protein [Holophagales bacterium]
MSLLPAGRGKRAHGIDDESRRRHRLRRRAHAARWVASLSFLTLALTLFHHPILESLVPRLGEGLARIGLQSSNPAPGFMAEVLSTPSGAEVRIDGAHRGTTPFFGNVRCKEGETVTLEVHRAGFETWSRSVPCRQRRTLRAHARLEPEQNSPG